MQGSEFLKNDLPFIQDTCQIHSEDLLQDESHLPILIHIWVATLCSGHFCKGPLFLNMAVFLIQNGAMFEFKKLLNIDIDPCKLVNSCPWILSCWRFTITESFLKKGGAPPEWKITAIIHSKTLGWNISFVTFTWTQLATGVMKVMTRQNT